MAEASPPDPCLQIVDLTVTYPPGVPVVDGVTLDVRSGETIGVVGESGSGKSTLAQAILGVLPASAQVASGEIRLAAGDREQSSVDLLRLDPSGPDLRARRGRDLSLVFQDAAASLSPTVMVGDQLGELLRLYGRDDRSVTSAVLGLLREVGIDDPAQVSAAYPYQLSGGLAQRVMIAMAICGRPRVLIADEPTSSLDPVHRDDVLALLGALRDARGMAILHIGHDLELMAAHADRLVVMYAGRIVEVGPAATVVRTPQHPYTRRLLETSPRAGTRGTAFSGIDGVMPRGRDRWQRCAFVSRCDAVSDARCEQMIPALVVDPIGCGVRCFLHHDRSDAG